MSTITNLLVVSGDEVVYVQYTVGLSPTPSREGLGASVLSQHCFSQKDLLCFLDHVWLP